MSPVEPTDQVWVPNTDVSRRGFDTYAEAQGFGEQFGEIEGCGTTGVSERDGEYYPTCVSVGVILPTWEIAIGSLVSLGFPEEWINVPPT